MDFSTKAKKSFRNIIFFTLFVFLPVNAECFERLHCSSSLGNWKVFNAMKKDKVVLDGTRPSGTFTKKTTSSLVIRDEELNVMGAILLWNGITFLPTKTPEIKHFTVNFERDQHSWFKISFVDKKSQLERNLNCSLIL